MFSKIWLGLLSIILVGLLWLVTPYLASAYYLGRGVKSISEGETQTAIEHLKRALDLNSENVLAYRRLAKIYLQLDQPGDALEPARQALQLNPHNPLVQLELGDVYDRLEDYEQAIVYYEAGGIGNREPQLVANYLALADQLWQAGNQEQAMMIWQNKVPGYSYGDLYANWRLWHSSTVDDQSSTMFEQSIMQFPLESINPATDPRLLNYQLEAMADIIQTGLWTENLKLNILSYLVWRSESPTTRSLLEGLAKQVPEDPDVWYYMGEFYRHHVEIKLAEDAYQTVIRIAPDYAYAYLRLGLLKEIRFSNGDKADQLAQARGLYLQYHSLNPKDPLGLKKLADLCELSQCDKNVWLTDLEDYLVSREPEFAINQDFNNGWFFLGYDVDEDRLARDEPVPLWLLWSTPAETRMSSDDENKSLYQLGNRFVQVIEVQNLIPNGSFEIGYWPIGLPIDVYRASPATKQLVSDVREGNTTHVALLNNTKEFDQSSFISEYFSISQDKLYLQAGWIKGQAGNAYLGHQWRGDSGSIGRTYIINSVSPELWTHYADIVKPPNGASEARVWLSNHKTTGKVYFDNIVFVGIDISPYPW